MIENKTLELKDLGTNNVRQKRIKEGKIPPPKCRSPNL